MRAITLIALLLVGCAPKRTSSVVSLDALDGVSGSETGIFARDTPEDAGYPNTVDIPGNASFDARESDMGSSEAGPGAMDAGGDSVSWVCPGHVDPCFAGNCDPSFSVKTADGAASIVSVDPTAGGCAIDEISDWLGNRQHPVDGGFPTLSTVEVFIGSACSSVPTDCSFSVGLADGTRAVVTVTYGQGVAIRQGRCLDNSDCCDRSQYVELVGTPCYLYPTQNTLGIPAVVDGGQADSPALSIDGESQGG